MAVTEVGSGGVNTGTSAGSSLTFPLSGVAWQTGDVAFINANANPSMTSFTGKPSGWTQQDDDTSNNLRFYTAYRVLQAGDPNPTVSIAPSTNQMAGTWIILRGVDTADIFGAATAYVEDANADNACEHPAVTPRSADDYVVWMAGGRGATNGTAVTHSGLPIGGTGDAVSERADTSSTRAGTPEVGAALWTQQLSAATTIPASTTTLSVSCTTSSRVWCIKAVPSGTAHVRTVTDSLVGSDAGQSQFVEETVTDPLGLTDAAETP
jgi:hypothetical protein